MQEIRQRFTASDSHDIHCPGFQNSIYGNFKGRAVQMVDRIFNFFYICFQNGGKYFRLRASSILDTDLLNRIQLIFDPFFQSLLKLGITVVSNAGCKPHHRGFAHLYGLSEFCRRHKHRLFIMVGNISRYRLMAFAHPRIFFTNL